MMNEIDTALAKYLSDEEPSERQYGCKVAFFGEELAEYWKSTGFKNSGPNQDALEMVQYAILESDVLAHKAMLRDWEDEIASQL